MVRVPTYVPIRPSSPHIGLIALGIVIILFFQCMSALLDPVNRTKGEINWKFMAHTAAMFSFATIYIAMNLNIQSISFVDNREFPGITTSDVLPPGPVGYQWFLRSKPIGVATTPMIILNNWLADGLLVSVSDLTPPQASNVNHSPALLMSHCLCDELLDHRLPMHYVSHLFGYVLKPTVNRL